MRRPGTRLRALAMRLFESQAMERVIDPLIADLQCEHDEAVSRSQLWRGCWIRIAGCIAFWKVAAIVTARSSTRELSAADHGAVRRTIRGCAIATTVTVGLLEWPVLHSPQSIFGNPPLLRLLLIPLYLIPQALAVALPMGLVFGVLCGLRGQAVTTRPRRLITLLLLLCSIVMLAHDGWLLPAANQAFRELAAGRPLSRGMNELTIGELGLHEGAALLRWIGPEAARFLKFEFHSRLALAFAPLALGLFSLELATRRRGQYGAFAASLMTLASCFAYYVLLYNARYCVLLYDHRAEIAGRLPAAVAGWAPNLIFAGAALALHLRTRAPSAADPNRRDDGRRSASRPVSPPA
ncbi:MAG: hypothetical protein JWL71_877 [Acidobacteria bacterium]|nr:hypothetical protein [Acidobacteriota bacterium]